MLRGISPILSPDLLSVLCAMGHGDEIVLGDSNFPGAGLARRLLRADGHNISSLLAAILPLFPLDTYATPLFMMQIAAGDQLDGALEAEYMSIVHRFEPASPAPVRVDKAGFYSRSAAAFAVLMTGETRLYGNIILKKGVIT
jgi:L-fucose mutarotase